jgi:hypothetical protein
MAMTIIGSHEAFSSISGREFEAEGLAMGGVFR